MPLSEIGNFEKANNVSINILEYADELFPLHISKNQDLNGDRHVNLLLVEKVRGVTYRLRHQTDTTVLFKMSIVF